MGIGELLAQNTLFYGRLDNCVCKRSEICSAYHLLKAVKLRILGRGQELKVDITEMEVETAGLDIDDLVLGEKAAFAHRGIELCDVGCLFDVCGVGAGSEDEADASVIASADILGLGG